MPFALTWKDRSLLVEFTGVTTLDDGKQVTDAWVGDMRFESCAYVLCDYRKIEEIAYSERDLKVGAAYNKAAVDCVSHSGVRIAYVVESPAMEAILRRFIDFTDERWERKIFPDMESAEAWCREVL